MNMDRILNSMTEKNIIWIVISLQLIWLLFAVIQLLKLRSSERRKKINYYTYESIPNTFVTIGLLGTCSGIALGLYKFDVNPENIRGSIQLLLTGLKSAFLVTILGLLLSLFFKWIINNTLIRYPDLQPPDSPELEQLKELNENMRLLGEHISESFRMKFESFLEDMRTINKHLLNKLDMFSSTLAEKNQEALVVALEDVVKDLNSGFKEILGTLVKQNFKSLTDSVDKLNAWQNQNKEQVSLLTESYTRVRDNTKGLDDSLKCIVNRMDDLVGQSSRIYDIIDQLRGIVIDDNRFEEISDRLDKTSKSLKESAAIYKDNLKEINFWFSQEHNIKEGILLLNNQLSTIEDVPSFNKRLSNTFGTLDKILAEYLEGIPKIIERHLKSRGI
jgi:hypothetical protein